MPCRAARTAPHVCTPSYASGWASGSAASGCTDITEHPTTGGKVYCCLVLDVFSPQVVGWSIADHVRSDLVVDALKMATWRRRPTAGTVVHSDRGPAIHLVGVRAPATDRRPARHDGPGCLLRGQRDDRVVLVHDAARAARPDLVADTRASGQRGLRVDRDISPTLLVKRRRRIACNASSARLR
jgi:hypothetical protein